MEIGNDDIDFMDDEYGTPSVNDTTTQDTAELNPEIDEQGVDTIPQWDNNGSPALDSDEGTFISALLKSRGIEDPAKIKFENSDGEIEEVDWNSLSVEDRLNILDSSMRGLQGELNQQEIQLINSIRQSNLSPAEYIQGVGRSSVQNYIESLQNQPMVYSVDQYSDEELYVMDLISKSQDITEEEALEALERAKSNDALFKKQMGAIRNEYKRAEEESLNYQRLKLEQDAQAQYNQFAETIGDVILNFKDFAGCELNMSEEDMQDLYTFITGFDNAGNSWLGKALNDPQTMVQMAWFALNGEQMIQDINEYYQKEISKVRKESYDKGLKDAGKKDTTTVTYKPKGKTNVAQTFDDLDEL